MTEIKKYISFADFLGEILGKNTEIAIHDLSNLENSIVYMLNGHISNRKEGDTITDLLLEFIQDKSKENTSYACNYHSKTLNNKILHSSTYFIRDENMVLIGAICLNSDYNDVEKSLNFVTSFLPNFTPIETEEKNIVVKENLHNSSQELTLSKISSIINDFNVIPKRMTTEEKAKIIAKFDKSGLFLIKGAVEKAASELLMSESSIYRYLKKMRE